MMAERRGRPATTAVIGGATGAAHGQGGRPIGLIFGPAPEFSEKVQAFQEPRSNDPSQQPCVLGVLDALCIPRSTARSFRPRASSWSARGGPVGGRGTGMAIGLLENGKGTIPRKRGAWRTRQGAAVRPWTCRSRAPSKAVRTS